MGYSIQRRNTVTATQSDGQKQTGFIAQEVEAAANKLNYDFSGVYKPQNDKDPYGLSYSDFVVPLVKAVQELSSQNEALQERVSKLEAMINGRLSTVNSQRSTVISAASLLQNVPNPFSQTTRINYTLPPKHLSAKIIITDKSGKVLKQVNLSGNGKGGLNLDASMLSSGAYQYSLFVDGKLIASKQMILTK